MSTSDFARGSALGLACIACSAFAESPGLGEPLDEATASAISLSVLPDGTGLPTGSGSVPEGQAVFEAKCASCHGAAAAGGEGLVEPMSGGIGSLATAAPIKTVNSYWPYATTLFDYTRRAMPLNAPLSLSNSEVYAVTAYILSLDGIVAKDARLDADSLAAVQMPNRDGFESQWPGHAHGAN